MLVVGQMVSNYPWGENYPVPSASDPLYAIFHPNV